MKEFVLVKKGLWFANEAPIDLVGVYKRLNVFPPGVSYRLHFDKKRWRVELRRAGEDKGESNKYPVSQSTFEMRDWMREQLNRVLDENQRTGGEKVTPKGSFISVDFGSVSILAGEALEKTIRASSKLPMEAFVVYATALLVDPDRKWCRWLTRCLQCEKVFYAKPTGGSRNQLCSSQCKKKRNADRVRRCRLGK